MRGWILKDGTPDTGCGIKVFERDVFMHMPRFRNMHRFMPALFQREGFEVVSLPVNHRERTRGTSKYGLHNRLWVGIVDLFGLSWLIRRASPRVGDPRGALSMTAAPGAPTSLLDRWLRPGADSPRDVTVDLLWLVGLALLLMGAGLGLRDPWPADEPRFALVARDMLRSGDWLIPRVGGDLYADKPPVFFWLMAAVDGRHRLDAARLPAAVAAGRRRRAWCWSTTCCGACAAARSAFAGALVLLLTFQFVWQFRQAQIDGVLCFFTTLSLYGLLRHLFAGPALGWFFVGWAAAGIGVITKGVGFLPLLVLVPFAVLARAGWPVDRAASRSRAGGSARCSSSVRSRSGSCR